MNSIVITTLSMGDLVCSAPSRTWPRTVPPMLGSLLLWAKSLTSEKPCQGATGR